MQIAQAEQVWRSLDRKSKELVALAIAERRRRRASPFRYLYPDEDTIGPNGEIIYARSKYPAQMEFYRVSAEFREVALMAANRTGKTLSGAFAVTSHLTGDYRPWWDGKTFRRPIRCWAAGKTNETTRDIVQTELLGAVKHGARKTVDGTGMIPHHLIGDITWKQGVSDLVDTVKIKHITGGWSLLGFKSYQQGRGSFEGTEQDVVWLDEECPMDIYTEALTRLATTLGILLMTFTPLEGLSETAMQFLPADQRPQA